MKLLKNLVSVVLATTLAVSTFAVTANAAQAETSGEALKPVDTFGGVLKVVNPPACSPTQTEVDVIVQFNEYPGFINGMNFTLSYDKSKMIPVKIPTPTTSNPNKTVGFERLGCLAEGGMSTSNTEESGIDLSTYDNIVVQWGITEAVKNSGDIAKFRFKILDKSTPIALNIKANNAVNETGGYIKDIRNEGGQITFTQVEPTKYNVTASSVTGGTITVNPTQAVAGQTVSVSAEPNAGYVLKSLTYNGNTISGNSFTMPAANVTVSAVFERPNWKPISKSGTTGVYRNKEYGILVTFDKEVSLSSAQANIKLLSESGSEIPVDVVITGEKVQIKPTYSELAINTLYTLKVGAALAAKDNSSDTLRVEEVYTFRTGNTIESLYVLN